MPRSEESDAHLTFLQGSLAVVLSFQHQEPQTPARGHSIPLLVAFDYMKQGKTVVAI